MPAAGVGVGQGDELGPGQGVVQVLVGLEGGRPRGQLETWAKSS